MDPALGLTAASAIVSALTQSRDAAEMATRIIDEGEGRDRDVIIQMKSDHRATSKFISRASDAIGQRSMALGARDILPEYDPTMKKGGRSSYQRRKLSENRSSASSQLAASVVRAPTTADVREASQESMRPLLSNSAVQTALATTGTTPDRAGFWSSNSVAVTLSKGDLDSVVHDVDTIAGVYRNRRLSVPRVVEVASLPDNVRDNKASSWGVQAVNALAAWGAFGFRGEGVTVGVLDTGIDPNHPDLVGKLAAWAEFDPAGQAIADSQPHDTDEHGTHVAGTVVGGNASGQWIGVAPDAKVAAAMVIDGQVGGTDAQILAGIDWAIDQGVDVINMSLGGVTLGPVIEETYTQAIISALLAGIPVVIAIGNNGEQTSGSPGNDLFSFAVGATDWEDRTAGFSGGRTHALLESDFIDPGFLPVVFSKPEVSAPGVAIESSVPGGGYKAFNGTSMATPHVSGALAVLLSATEKLQGVPAQERAFLAQDILTGSVEELGERGQDHRFGFGRIDVLRAVGSTR